MTPEEFLKKKGYYAGSLMLSKKTGQGLVSIAQAMQEYAEQQLFLHDVSVSLFDTLQDLIEVYEEREAKASKMGNWSEAFQNEIRVGVLQHLAQLHKHKNNER
jgi:hypothetical protein